MVLISRRALREFWERHPDAEPPLRDWATTVAAADWSSLHQVRAVYPQADAVADARGRTRTVFNVRGNRYRLVVRIVYAVRTVYVTGVMTHAEDDRGRRKE